MKTLTASMLAAECLDRGAMQKQRELADLIGLVLERAPRVVVEIGTASGGTWWAWSQLDTDVLISVDLLGGPFGGEPSDLHYREWAPAAHYVTGSSHDPLVAQQVDDILAGRAIDFLFIDGDHTYDGVRQDWEMYSPLVDGLVAFHDIMTHPHGNPPSQVDVLWDELWREGAYEFVDLSDSGFCGQPHWGGIGVLEVSR